MIEESDKLLLEIASGTVKITQVPTLEKGHNRSSDPHALKFVKHFNITAGDMPVPTLNFYYLYTKWQKYNRITRHQFTADLKKIFKIQKKGKYRYFYVSSFPNELIDITKREQTRRSESRFRKTQHERKKHKQEKVLQRQTLQKTSSTDGTSESKN